MSDNVEIQVQMARLEERLRIISEGLIQDRESRKQQYERAESLNTTMNAMDNRVKSIEESLARNAPTIEEFITIKHRVVGAGMMGKWVWVFVGGLLGIIFTMRMEIIRWLSK
ncbi:putative tail-length tape measure protein [Erwinia phage vB_EamP_Frozen]|uniref:Tail-length tape measure protein n=3 Tax=Johnsonvirus frozen TaxID=1982578 RepID=A0A191ZCV1_9CAUD|nr:putative tail-length tape measure protein [Erwinia phage vB_EamP_Frozen]ANJ65213.1 putative tail-length tape measure protein [Erwinia phage vB_EamP_Frozen]ANJ65312.1 putative tail-length tape measure protein [Erwinia phage vB_EamP_Rexella]ANJ65388.1 putative tail-length tape measure protein [Erwinia phage vB_EamP_Gutmeister]